MSTMKPRISLSMLTRRICKLDREMREVVMHSKHHSSAICDVALNIMMACHLKRFCFTTMNESVKNRHLS